MYSLKFMLYLAVAVFVSVNVLSQPSISNTSQLVMNKPFVKNNNGNVERITLSVKNATFKSIYQMVRTRISYGLIIDQDLIKIAYKADIELKKGTITDFLKIISAKFPLEYNIRNRVIFIKFKSLPVGNFANQPIVLTLRTT